jgi:hypothetical protein
MDGWNQGTRLHEIEQFGDTYAHPGDHFGIGRRRINLGKTTDRNKKLRKSWHFRPSLANVRPWHTLCSKTDQMP